MSGILFHSTALFICMDLNVKATGDLLSQGTGRQKCMFVFLKI